MGQNWWVGNWWAGASGSSSPGDIALDERIMQLIKPALETITVAGGFHQDVAVHRPPVAAYDFAPADCPALVIRRLAKVIRVHIRRAEEFVLRVQVIGIVANSGADPYGDLSNLMGDLKKVVYANRRWNDGSEDLARRTYITDDGIHEPEVDEATLTSELTFDIVARADQEDLTAVRDV